MVDIAIQLAAFLFLAAIGISLLALLSFLLNKIKNSIQQKIEHYFQYQHNHKLDKEVNEAVLADKAWRESFKK